MEVELVIQERSLLNQVDDLIAEVDQTLRDQSESLYKAQFDVCACNPNRIKVELNVTKHGNVRYLMNFTVRDRSDFYELKNITAAIVESWCQKLSTTDVFASEDESDYPVSFETRGGSQASPPRKVLQ